MSAEDNKAVVRRFAETYGSHDVEGARATLAEDIVVYHTGANGTLDVEGYRQVGEMFLNAFPDLTMSIEDQVAEGDRVVTRWIFRGTHQGELQGIPPTGQQVEIPTIAMDRIEGGKIAERRVVFDQMAMMQQLGLVPAQQ